MSSTLNERAQRLADYMAANASTLRIATQQTPSGARVIDCGVQTAGGLQAGLGLARVCLAGLGDLARAPGHVGAVAGAQVTGATYHPRPPGLPSQSTCVQLP